jgi:hypothetical protein
VGLNVASEGSFAQLSAASSKKSRTSGKSKNTKKSRTPKKVREARADAFRRGVNSVIAILITLVVLFGAFEVWMFLGRPGWPVTPRGERYTCLELWFHDNSVTYLVPVHRNVTLAPGDCKTVRAVQEFADGPRDPYLARIYPDDVPLPTVTKDGRTAVVDLPREILSHLGGTMRERALLDALTLTVASAGECDNVRVMIGGEAAEATPEGYDLTEPLSPPTVINHVPDSSLSGDSKWVTVYYLDSSGRYLLPLSLEVPADSVDGNIAVERLLENPPQLSYPPPLPVAPAGYMLERITIENGTGTVELAVPNIQSNMSEQEVDTFRRAVYLTLKKCCSINNVVLKLNGIELESYSRFSDLPDLNNAACWNIERSPDDTMPAGQPSTRGEDV